jgi:hypothetical protein
MRTGLFRIQGILLVSVRKQRLGVTLGGLKFFSQDLNFHFPQPVPLSGFIFGPAETVKLHDPALTEFQNTRILICLRSPVNGKSSRYIRESLRKLLKASHYARN